MKPTLRSSTLRARAERLAALLPMGRLHPAVREWAEAATRRAPWVVACSGGADSLALLLLLWAHWPERRAALRVLHFNHRLRGADSGRDAVFCRRVCDAIGVRVEVGRWGRPAGAGPASEAEARTARQDFFAGWMRRWRARELWLGHQQDDIAETMLMRLARGSGTAGLAAPRPVQTMPGGRMHLRPLLVLKKAEICAALREAGIPWREDASNATGRYFRNRVRKEVIPAWCAAAERDGLAGAARSRELLEEDDEALDAWLTAIRPVAADGSLNLRRLAGKPRAIWRRAVYLWLRQQPQGGRNLSRQAFEVLLQAAVGGQPKRLSLGTAGFAVVRAGQLRFAASGGKQPR